MNCIGNEVVAIPEGVTVTQERNNVTVRGLEGELTRAFSVDVKINIKGNEATFARPNDSKEMETIHGAARANSNNIVIGVSEGFQEALEPIGVEYRTQLQGSKLVLNVDYSHSVEVTPPTGVTVEVSVNTQITARGASKGEVGELVADIRETHPPESYEGKGVRYVDECVRRREGKTGK